MGRTTARTSGLTAVAALAACAPVAEPARSALLPGARYVAMGSSFAAGPGLGQFKPGTPQRCSRTAASYPSLLAALLGLDLIDATCSGARTDHVIGAWNELPAQVDAVTPDTRLVTVTIGGNDLNYVGELFGAHCRATVRLGTAPAQRTCPAPKPPTAADYSRLEANLRLIAREVRARAPAARLVFVQYVTLVPPQPCAAAMLEGEDSAVLREIGSRLAATTVRVAHEEGALLLPADELSRVHHPCSGEPWSLGFPPTYKSSDGAPWHPNAAGMRAIADMLAEKLDQDQPNLR